MDPKLGLLYLPSLAGATLLAVGCWLVSRAKVIVDKETSEVLNIDLPMLGKFKTNSPAIALFIMSFLLMFVPIYYSSKSKTTTQVTLFGQVDSPNYPVNIYAVSGNDPMQNEGQFNIVVPVAENQAPVIKVLFAIGDKVMSVDANLGDVKNGRLEVEKPPLRKWLTDTTPAPQGTIIPIPPEFAGKE